MRVHTFVGNCAEYNIHMYVYNVQCAMYVYRYSYNRIYWVSGDWAILSYKYSKKSKINVRLVYWKLCVLKNIFYLKKSKMIKNSI